MHSWSSPATCTGGVFHMLTSPCTDVLMTQTHMGVCALRFALCGGGCGGIRIYMLVCVRAGMCACVHACMHILCVQFTFLYSCMGMGMWMYRGKGGGACTYVCMCLHVPTFLCSSFSPSGEPCILNTHWGSTHTLCVFISQ